MCGIVGIVSEKDCVGRLLHGLERLEYRGYDSAGIAFVDESGHRKVVKAVGKVENLINKVADSFSGTQGIGHTRWATHGGISEQNAHPHTAGRVALAHNGMIENEKELRAAVREAGRELVSETDSEVIAHLIDMELENSNDAHQAIQAVVKKLRGAFALAVIIDGQTDHIYGARRGAPLLAGYGKDEGILVSDPMAIDASEHSVIALRDGDTVEVWRGGLNVVDSDGISNPPRETVNTAYGHHSIDRGQYRHFMQKEIAEQPEVLGRVVGHYIDMSTGETTLPEEADFSSIQRLHIVACGTASYAGRVAETWFETHAKLVVRNDIASEFRYADNVFLPGDAALFISQSGETADTLEALRRCKREGIRTFALVNVEHSTIAREADVVLPTLAGPEIGVASTKAFICQLGALACIAMGAARQRNVISDAEYNEMKDQIISTPRVISEVLSLEGEIAELAASISNSSMVFYLGRGAFFPLALEAALKLKEISYLFSEGYAGGELKHGPIALIDEKVSVVVMVTNNAVADKMRSSIRQVASRRAKVIALADKDSAPSVRSDVESVIEVPSSGDLVSLFSFAVVAQLIAYYVAIDKGTDIDQPRNLAKSVTVE